MDSTTKRSAASGKRQADRRSDQIDKRQYTPIRRGTKEHVILSALASGRSLNRFQAAKLHDTCLNSTISTLQGKGLYIDRAWEKVPCLNGTRTVSVCRYSLPADEIVRARHMLGIVPGGEVTT